MSDVLRLLNPHDGRKGFPIYNLNQLAQWPRVSWLVDGIIQEKSSAVIYGESRIGKSFLALDLAYKMALGADWFGYKVSPCKVLFFAAESPAGLPGRVDAIKTVQPTEPTENLFFMRSPIDLSDKSVIEKLVDTVAGFDAVFVDTYNAASSSSDENNSKDTGVILDGIRRIVEETGCTVVFVHHCGWSDNDRLRGHSSFSAAMDTRILVQRDGGHPSWRVKGQREGADTEGHRYALRQVELSYGTSCVVESLTATPAAKVEVQPRSGNQRHVFQTAKRLLAESQVVELETLISAAMTGIDADSRHQRQRADEAAEALRKSGFIHVDSQGFVTI